MAIITLAKAKTYLGITTTASDALITLLIPQIEGDFLIIRNAPFDEDSNDDIVYPDNAELVAAQMIGYRISTLQNTSGLKSEKIGSYAYTNADSADLIKGYPKSIVASIERYMSTE